MTAKPRDGDLRRRKKGETSSEKEDGRGGPHDEGRGGGRGGPHGEGRAGEGRESPAVQIGRGKKRAARPPEPARANAASVKEKKK